MNKAVQSLMEQNKAQQGMITRLNNRTFLMTHATLKYIDAIRRILVPELSTWQGK